MTRYVGPVPGFMRRIVVWPTRTDFLPAVPRLRARTWTK